ncbi:MAG TPA: hypothetical protein PKD24_00835 [Pyrinomonadaceae bacterium]|nr:hypothetical protein [Pyrinomonadaceae bacterium]HMP64299.1 hypothetical protein [Pyrinomonadaceae bacterium]
MKFEKGIAKEYRGSVEDALETIAVRGNNSHRMVAEHILGSEMLVCVKPVSKVKASGITGLIDRSTTNESIAEGALSLREALGQVYITIAEETIDNGGRRGCEGTFVHEGRHAYDFARVIESLSRAGTNPLSLFDPTLFELEWDAHRTSAEYMLCINKDEYLEEGLQLMILGRENENGIYFVDEDGIARRLRQSYGLERGRNEGPLVSELLGLKYD